MNNREKICVWLFEKSQGPYAKYFKSNKPWDIGREELLSFPTHTLGYALGVFLTENGFDLISKLERHDVFHVITEYGTSVKEEIALQYFFLGNKKRSLYLFSVIFIGTLLLPEHLGHYFNSFREGKDCAPFHKWNIKALLNEPLNEIREAIFNKEKACIPLEKQIVYK